MRPTYQFCFHVKGKEGAYLSRFAKIEERYDIYVIAPLLIISKKLSNEMLFY